VVAVVHAGPRNDLVVAFPVSFGDRLDMVVASNLLHRLDGQRLTLELVLDLGEEAELQGTGSAE
jgi:hypothetical protein